ncbi:hypothetical protein [Streptomyces sp. NPDC020667]|uniref:hypothetical protein n=1 Tax=Streptomyces sp. NPDC020667 TaxID=3154895 RepID=UPI00340C98BB
MDSQTMYTVDLSGAPAPLGMQAWSDDRGRMPAVVFAASHRVETFATRGGPGPDPHLRSLEEGGWGKFGDLAGWSEPVPGWSAVLDVSADAFTVTGPGDVTFYEGALNSSKAWRRGARKHGLFLARRRHREPRRHQGG